MVYKPGRHSRSLWRCPARDDRTARHENQDQDRTQNFEAGDYLKTSRRFARDILDPAYHRRIHPTLKIADGVYEGEPPRGRSARRSIGGICQQAVSPLIGAATARIRAAKAMAG